MKFYVNNHCIADISSIKIRTKKEEITFLDNHEDCVGMGQIIDHTSNSDINIGIDQKDWFFFHFSSNTLNIHTLDSNYKELIN